MPEHDPTTTIGPGTLIKGEMTCQQPTRILGTVEGTIEGGVLEIGSGATCRATVRACTIVVDGTVEGDLHAAEKLELNSSARIVGDLAAASLSVSEGASFSGHCTVGKDAVDARRPTAESPAASAASSGGEPAGDMELKVTTTIAKPEWLGAKSDEAERASA